METIKHKYNLIVILVVLLLITVVGAIYTAHKGTNTTNISFTNPIFTNTASITPVIPQVQSVNGGLVTNFPNFPIYPGSKVSMSLYSPAVTSPSYQQAYYQVFLSTNKSVPEIIDWYSQQLKKDGWTVQDRSEANSNSSDQSISASNKVFTATVNAEQENGESATISIYISPISR